MWLKWLPWPFKRSKHRTETPLQGAATSTSEASATADVSMEQYREVLEERTRRYLGMSLEDFYRRLDANDLPDTAAVAHIKTLTGAAASESKTPTGASASAR